MSAPRPSRGGGGIQLPNSFFGPIGTHAAEDFGRWGCDYDWVSWNGPQAFAARRNEIEAAKAGGFRLIAHTALKLVIKPLVNSKRLTQEAYDELEAICEKVAIKVIAAKQAEDDRRAKEKSGTGDPTSNIAEINQTVSAVLQGASYSFIREPLQAHWNEFVGGLKDDQRVALYKTLRQISDEGETSKRQQVIKDIMQIEDRNERLQVAIDRGLIPT